VATAGLDASTISTAATRLLALELYHADKVSLGRAAELCNTSGEEFMEFAARHNAALRHGSQELEEDLRTLERLGL